MYKNIVFHWTGGNYAPCSVDFNAYHFLVDKEGNVSAGKYTPEDNLNCGDGKYARHCGGGNTARIGIAICCMKDKNTPPLQKQVEAMCKQAARLCYLYNINPNQCITHAEFGMAYPNTSSKGKQDINTLPYANKFGVKACGDYLRNKTQVYYDRIKRGYYG